MGVGVGSADPADIRRLTLTDALVGTTLIGGELDAEGAALLRTALDSLAAPQPALDGTPDRRTPARRRADVLVSRVLGAAAVPETGGVRPHLTITIDWNTLLAAGIQPALTSWGLPLPHSTLARLACRPPHERPPASQSHPDDRRGADDRPGGAQASEPEQAGHR